MRIGVMLVAVAAACKAPAPSARRAAPEPRNVAAEPARATSPAAKSFTATHSPEQLAESQSAAIDARGCAEQRRPPRPWHTSDAALAEAKRPFSTELDTARHRLVPPESTQAWARFIVDVHHLLHPIFTDGYLASLCALDRGAPLNDPKLACVLELAVAADGSLARIGVVESSGHVEFDGAAIEAFRRIAPMPRPSVRILSEDRLAHFRWKLHRVETLGCSTMLAQPFFRGGS